MGLDALAVRPATLTWHSNVLDTETPKNPPGDREREG